MRFTKKNANTAALKDNVYPITAAANQAVKELGADKVYNATIGSLYDEEGKIVALKSVYDAYRGLETRLLASYSPAIKGVPAYNEAVKKWILRDHAKQLQSAVVATAGGTGAIAVSLNECMNDGETVLLPKICWASYKLIAETCHLRTAFYDMFEEDHFNLASLKQEAEKIMDAEGRLCLVINSPCHNPTGYSLTDEEWEKTVALLNELSEKGPVILVNDIAYIDFAKDPDAARNYLDAYNELTENVVVVLAFSCSKTMTAYGMRTGAAIILSKSKEAVTELENVFERYARSTWSNINHGFMEAFVVVMNEKKEEYLAEKKKYIDLLAARTELFKKEAAECGLECYPYCDGYFLTVKTENDQKRDLIHKALLEQQIYTVKIGGGIRIALCSLPLKRCGGLAKKIKDTVDSIA